MRPFSPRRRALSPFGVGLPPYVADPLGVYGPYGPYGVDPLGMGYGAPGLPLGYGAPPFGPRVRAASPRARRPLSPRAAAAMASWSGAEAGYPSTRPRSPRSMASGVAPPLLPDGTLLLVTVHEIEVYPMLTPSMYLLARYAAMEAKGNPPDAAGRIVESFEFPYQASQLLVIRLVDADLAEDVIAETRVLDIERLLGCGSDGEWYGEADFFALGPTAEPGAIRGKLTLTVRLTAPLPSPRLRRVQGVPLAPRPVTASDGSLYCG